MKILTFRNVLTLLLVMVVAGCSGGGGSSSAEKGTASLVITVDGLASGVNADILVKKSTTFSQAVTASTTLSNLDSGNYTVTAKNVTDGTNTFTPDTASQVVNLLDRQSKTVIITYIQQVKTLKRVSSKGSITSFSKGSSAIVVNGVQFSTANAQVDTDDTTMTTDSVLRLGMVVDISGNLDVDTGETSADHIVYSAKVEGPIASIDLVNNSFVVLGQTVVVNNLTEFSGIIFDTLQVNQSVEVSGVSNAAGDIEASRIELSGASETAFKLQGTVENLDDQAKTFVLNNVTIDYSGAQVSGNLVASVKVKVTSTQNVANGILLADTVKLLENQGGQDNGGVEGDERGIEGIITQYTSATDFYVGDVAITTDANTQFIYGAVSSLQANVHVSVNGQINASNVLLATKIRFDEQGDTKTHGRVEAVDVQSNQVTMMGMTFQADSTTKFKDESAAQEKSFDLTFVNLGDRLEIDAFTSNTNVLVAREITRRDDNPSQGEVLQGKVSAINSPELTVNNVRVMTSDATDFEAGDNRVLNGSEFFTQLSLDMEVKIKGSIDSNGAMLSASIEIRATQASDEQNGRIELNGSITLFNSAQDFEVNHHKVSTNTQTQFRYGTAANLKLGALVEIKGNVNASNVIEATRVKFDSSSDNSGSDNGDSNVEFAGAINNFISATEFFVGNQQVTISDTALYENGTAINLANGVLVKIEGTLQVDGIVLAKKVEFKSADGGS